MQSLARKNFHDKRSSSVFTTSTTTTTATTTATTTCTTTTAIDSSYPTISIGPWRKSLLHSLEIGYVLDIRFTHDKWSGNNKKWSATN